MIARTRRVRRIVGVLRGVGAGLLVLIGAYLVVRAVLQPFVIDTTDPSSYAGAWGGPSLLGVMVVHMLPGAVALVLLVVYAARWVRRRRARRFETA